MTARGAPPLTRGLLAGASSVAFVLGLLYADAREDLFIGKPNSNQGSHWALRAVLGLCPAVEIAGGIGRGSH
jgi:hypothetical protein